MRKILLGLFAAQVSASLFAANVYYSSSAPGGDGSTLATAFNDFAAAVEAAGSGGEVRVATGFHRPCLTKTGKISCPAFRLVGGYVADDRRVTDPGATVFSGDLQGDDVYVNAAGDERGSVMLSDSEFRQVKWEEGDVYWKLANYGDNVTALLVADDTVESDFGMRLEGITFTGFGNKSGGGVLTAGKLCKTAVTNCQFIGNAASGAYSAGVVMLKAESRVTDCAFVGNTGAGLGLMHSDWKTESHVERCSFAYGYGDESGGRAVCIAVDRGYLGPVDCDFMYNYATGFGESYGPRLAVSMQDIVGEVLSFVRCRFVGNTAISGTACALPIATTTRDFIDCEMRDNTMVANAAAESTMFVADNNTSHSGDAVTGVMSNCVVSGNVLTDPTKARAQYRYLFAAKYAYNVAIEGNEMTVDVNNDVDLIKIGQSNQMSMRNVSFYNNRVENTSELANKFVRLFGYYSYRDALDVSAIGNTLVGRNKYVALCITGTSGFVNAMFARNKLSSSGSGVAATVIDWGGSTGFANSTFFENDAPCDILTSSSSGLRFVSSIAWGGDDYVFFKRNGTATGTIWAYLSDIKGLAELDKAGLVGRKSGNIEQEPKFRQKVYRAKNGTHYLRLDFGTPCQNLGGVSHHLISGNTFFTAWNGTGHMRLTYDATYTIDSGFERLTDLIGMARQDDEITLGAVQTIGGPGLNMIVR